MALSIRISHHSMTKTGRVRNHNLRHGPQPKYIDTGRRHLNTVILEPAPPGELRRLCEERRKQRDGGVKRAMKSDAAVSTSFIISFGHGLQPHVRALSPERQDELYRAVLQAIMSHLGTTETGLVVHRDETAPHAHGQAPACHPDGRPLSKHITPAVASRLQEVAMQAAMPFLPMIERGVKKEVRLDRGDDLSAIYNRSVRELHEQLPAEIAAARGRFEEMQARVLGLEARAHELTEKEQKRVETYRKRRSDRLQVLRDLEQRQREMAEDVLQTAMALESREVAVKHGEAALKEERAALARQAAELKRREADLTATLAAAAKEAALAAAEVAFGVISGDVFQAEQGKWKVLDPERVRPFWAAIAPTVKRLADWWNRFRPRVEALPDADREDLLRLPTQ